MKFKKGDTFEVVCIRNPTQDLENSGQTMDSYGKNQFQILNLYTCQFTEKRRFNLGVNWFASDKSGEWSSLLYFFDYFLITRRIKPKELTWPFTNEKKNLEE